MGHFGLRYALLDRLRWVFAPLLLLLSFSVCFAGGKLRVGAERTEAYLPFLEGKRVGVLCNHTSLVGSRHLADTLRSLGIKVARLFTPEHGLQGWADAGEVVPDAFDSASGLRVVSLYGDRKRPRAEDLAGLDVMIYDLQDVGVRCYTYISTLHYMMEACAREGVRLLVFDRPNPNGFYVDGPVLKLQYRSFVGMHPVAWVHGMTVGEFAHMINEEGWLGDSVRCDLLVLSCENYTHSMPYKLPVPPSPNLPNQLSVYLYPSLAFFEGTRMSVGRGTSFAFQVVGAPEVEGMSFSFVPEPRPGAKNPPYRGKRCYGLDLRNLSETEFLEDGRVRVEYLQQMYAASADKSRFFNSFFTQLAGDPALLTSLRRGVRAEEVSSAWEQELRAFRVLRQRYLLYPDSPSELRAFQEAVLEL